MGIFLVRQQQDIYIYFLFFYQNQYVLCLGYQRIYILKQIKGYLIFSSLVSNLKFGIQRFYLLLHIDPLSMWP